MPVGRKKTRIKEADKIRAIVLLALSGLVLMALWAVNASLSLSGDVSMRSHLTAYVAHLYTALPILAMLVVAWFSYPAKHIRTIAGVLAGLTILGVLPMDVSGTGVTTLLVAFSVLVVVVLISRATYPKR